MAFMNNQVLNPLFPFHIHSFKAAGRDRFDVKNGEQIILLKKGALVSNGRAVEAVSLVFLTGESFPFIEQCSFPEGLRMIYKPLLLNQIALNTFERSVISEILEQRKQAEKQRQVLFYPLAKDTSVDLTIVFNKIMSEYTDKKQGYHAMIRHTLMELFLLCNRSFLQVIKDTVKRNEIDVVIDYVNHNYSEDITLQKLADISGFNPSYLSRLFKEKVGKSIFETINNLRINKACKLLKNTNLTIIEIAYTVGYNNVSFFNRYFRKIMNRSPSEYRNQL